MDLQTVLTAVDSWPAEDRLRLIEAVWDGLTEEGYEPALTEDLKALLDRRLAALDANSSDVLTWDERLSGKPRRGVCFSPRRGESE